MTIRIDAPSTPDGGAMLASAVPAPATDALLHVPPDPSEMAGRATEAAALLKSLAHPGRLMLLCHIAEGEKSVSDLEQALGERQAAVSQQLARLRAEGLVACRPAGKQRLYRIADPRAVELVALLCRLTEPQA